MLRRATIAATLVVGALTAVPSAVATDDDAQYSDTRYDDATTVAVEGELVQIVSDDFHEHTASHHYSLSTDDGPTLGVTFTEDVPAGSFSGDLVVDPATAKEAGLARGASADADTTRGTTALDTLAESAGTTPVASAVIEREPQATAAPRAHRAYVALMNGATPSTTAVTDALSYWTTEAGGAITSFPIAAQATFSSTASGCGMANGTAAGQAWDAAAAKFKGVSFGQDSGNHLIVMVPSTCTYTGLGTLGFNGLSSGGKILVNSGASTVVQTGVHELGHNFGLDHANQDDHAQGEYYDLYSPMGLGVSGADPAFTSPALGTLYRSELELTGADEITTVETGAPQSFELAPRGSASGIRGLLVTDPADGEQYSIDWRPRTQRDGGAFYGTRYGFGSSRPTYGTGIVIERQDGDGATYLQTRQAGATTFGSFVAGTAFAPSEGLNVTVDAIGASAATVTVSFPGAAGAPGPAGPELPSFTGTPKVDETLWADPGEWPDGTDDFTYAWVLDGVVADDTEDMFQVPPSAVGRTLRLDVTATPPGETEPVTRSSPAKTVQPGTYTPGRVTVSGTPAVGRTLSSSSSGWPPGTRLDREWFVGSTRIGTGSTVVLPASARSRAVVLRATPVRPGYTSTAVTVTTRAVAAGTLSTATPRISGRAKANQVLAVSPGTWGPRGVRLTYQWYANGKAISKATGSRLRLTSSMVGKPISVRVTGTLTGYTTTSRYSTRTARVVR